MDWIHAAFLEDLKKSKAGVAIVARWLRSLGLIVAVGETTEAKTRKEWRKHSDSGDIFILVAIKAKQLVVLMRIEVKQLSCDFTSTSDWPFGKSFIVCAKNSYDRAQFKPLRYLILNRAGTHIAQVHTKKATHWYVRRRKDRRDGTTQLCYYSPLEQVEFFKLPKIE